MLPKADVLTSFIMWIVVERLYNSRARTDIRIWVCGRSAGSRHIGLDREWGLTSDYEYSHGCGYCCGSDKALREETSFGS